MKLSILNRTTGPQILRLFDICFKRGVLDACEHGDLDELRRFVDDKTDNWTFGVVGDDRDIDWREYRFVVYKWCRRTGLTVFAENYLMMIRKENIYWCLLPYCMRFYLLGVKEWIEYPNPTKIEIFKTISKGHWDLKNNMAKFTKMDYISSMHDFAMEYRESTSENRPVTDAMMDNFCIAIYDLTRKYGRKSL